MSHLDHASAARLFADLELSTDHALRQRSRRLWLRSIDRDWDEAQLRPLLLLLSRRRTRAENGRGSAGQCPASTAAKTPAVGERCRHVVAVGSPTVRANHGPAAASFELCSDAAARVRFAQGAG